VVNAGYVPKVRGAHPVSDVSAGGDRMMNQKTIAAALAVASILVLSACVTARMHTQDELNAATRLCGLALGELIQDEEQKKLLLAIRQEPTAEQRACVAKWARRNGLKPVFVNMNFPAG
jgi:hypothetical protein